MKTDWIPRAGVPAAVTARLGRGLLARLPGVGGVLAAVRDGFAWQRARVDYLESLVAGLARAVPARPWLDGGERPALLLGTGGGGTRILGEAAARMGVVLGTRVNESFDSVEWAPLVYDLVLGAAPGGRVLELARAVHAPWARDGVGWGIKLPELLLALPPFIAAFPGARLVLLTRHPVAAALRRPHLTTLPEHPIGRAVLERAYRGTGRDPRRDPQHLRNALAWRWQIQQALAARPGLTMRVEAFDDDTLADFLGRPRPRERVAVSKRRLAVPRDRRARHIMALCGPLAAELGY